LGSSESKPARGAKSADLRKGSWGGERHPDFVPQAGEILVKEHWAQSGFAKTDLDFQLKRRGVTHVVPIGLLANTCIESTARYAMELGYHVTLVRDATAAVSQEVMHAAHDLNGPTFAHAILTTPELLAALPPAASRTSPSPSALWPSTYQKVHTGREECEIPPWRPSCTQ
jgi:nicotinamidase-related amidase